MHRDTRVRLFSHRMPGHIVLAVRGELDIATAVGLRDRITIVPGDTTLPVIVGLSGVSLRDASGPALLTGALAAPRRDVSKPLRISGLDDVFAMNPTLAAARRGQARPCRRAAA